MFRLEEIKKGSAITGIEPGQVVRVIAAEWAGDHALTVIYRTSDGQRQGAHAVPRRRAQSGAG